MPIRTHKDVQHYREDLVNRLTITEHEVSSLKNTVNNIDTKLDKVAGTLTALVSKPVTSVSNYLQAGAFTVTIVLALVAGITYLAGNSQLERIHQVEMSNLRQDYEIKINALRHQLEGTKKGSQ